jgi:hypothetical protein
MNRFTVDAERVTSYTAVIEAATLEEAQAILDEMIMDDFDEENQYVTIGDLEEIDGDTNE